MNEWETCIAEWATRCHEKDATIAALQAIIKQMGEQACVLAKDGMAAKAQVEALQRELESANALLHKKNCAIGKAETTIEALQRERDEAFFAESRHNGTKAVVFSPDFSQVCKYADQWVPVHAGSDG